MSTAPRSASRQVRSEKKKGSSSSRPPSSDPSPQKLYKPSFTANSSDAVMDKLEDKKDDPCSEHDVLLHRTKAEKPKIATSHTSKGTESEKPKIATSQGNGPRPFRIIGGDPFVPGTDNYRRMLAQRRRLYEQGQKGSLFAVCEGDPLSPDNFLKSVAAGKCCGPHKRGWFADSWP